MNPFGIQGQLIAAGLIAAVAFGGGWKTRDLFADAADGKRATAALAAAKKNTDRVVAADKVTVDVGRKAEDRQVEIRWQTKTIIREVPVYVTAETDRRYPLPVGLVRLHDAAALGLAAALPDPAGRPDDAASGVTASALGETVVDNYGTCRADQAKLEGLQDWVRQQTALWDKP